MWQTRRLFRSGDELEVSCSIEVFCTEVFCTLDPPRLPLCQTARLCVLVRPRASFYCQFCACRHLEEGGECPGHSCAHALGTTAPLLHAGVMHMTDSTLSRLKLSVRCRYALLRDQNCVPHSFSSAGFSLPQFVRPPHASTPRSAVLHHPLLWLPAAPHRLSCPFFSGPCSLQSLPTRGISWHRASG